jgi:hypothetical protein
MKWNKVTEVLPPDGTDVLVWTGTRFIVSYAEYYGIEELSKNMVGQRHAEEIIASAKKAQGKFREFGGSYYFDDPKVYWAELPTKPEDA